MEIFGPIISEGHCLTPPQFHFLAFTAVTKDISDDLFDQMTRASDFAEFFKVVICGTLSFGKAEENTGGGLTLKYPFYDFPNPGIVSAASRR